MYAIPRSEKFNIVSDNHGHAIFAFQFVKPILQAITHLIQYTVLEIQFWSVKCTTVTVQYARNIEHFHSHQAMQAVVMVRLYENKPLQNAFERI